MVTSFEETSLAIDRLQSQNQTQNVNGSNSTYSSNRDEVLSFNNHNFSLVSKKSNFDFCKLIYVKFYYL